jgi:soluble lytic murein transglycosylase-like protein
MRRRALRLIRRAGLIAPALVAVAAQAETAGPAMKDHRAHESAPTVARTVPTPGEVAPSDPVAAAFGLFPVKRAATAGVDPIEPIDHGPPPPVTVAETEPGVVVVERVVVATPPAVAPPAVEPAPVAPAADAASLLAAPEPMAEMRLAYAAPEAISPVDRVLAAPAITPTEVAGLPRRFEGPMPRRRPKDAVATPEPAMRLASLEPEPVRSVTPQVAPIVAEGVFGEPKKIPRAAEPYMALLRREAAANKVPLWLAVGVGWVESKYQPSLRGTHGVVGLMQVMPSMARYQGYRGPTEKLLEPETNIVWGMRELGWTWAKSGGNPCLAIAKYKGGIATRGISSSAADYCRKAKAVTGMI